MADIPSPEILRLLTEITSSPAMVKMRDLGKRAKDAGLEPAIVDEAVPVLCRLMMAHKGKEKEISTFILEVLVAANTIGPELGEILSRNAETVRVLFGGKQG